MLKKQDRKKLKKIVKIIGNRSSCERLKVGAILLNKKGYIISEGRNGTLPNTSNICEEDIYCERCNGSGSVDIPHGQIDCEQCNGSGKAKSKDEVVHAEMNCLLAYSGNYHKKLKLVCNYSPCLNCAKHIAAFKHGAIKEVYYVKEYAANLKQTKELFKKCGIHFKKI